MAKVRVTVEGHCYACENCARFLGTFGKATRKGIENSFYFSDNFLVSRGFKDLLEGVVAHDCEMDFDV